MFAALRALVEREGRKLATSKVAVQGLGNVGAALCGLLHREGVELVVADVDDRAVARIATSIPVQVSDATTIHRTDATVFSPCALGAVLNERSIAELGARMVVGAANNQLATAADGERLRQRGILYAPDYVVNAGGIINCAAEYLCESQADVSDRVGRISKRILAVIERAESDGIAPSTAADRMANEILNRQVAELA